MIDAVPSPSLVRSILPLLADQAGVDWSRPVAAWDAITMIGFLQLASRLISEADDQDHLLTQPAKRYVLKLQPLPGVDPIRSLRWVLKGLLRRHGLRCVDIREEHHDDA